jgi:hypothetical protein
MKIFSLLKIDDENSLKVYPLLEWRLDRRAVSPYQSGGTTAPIDGVSAILTETQIFCVRIVNIIFFTSFYTSRIRFPTDAQLFSSLNERQGLISSEGVAHTKQPSLLLSI